MTGCADERYDPQVTCYAPGQVCWSRTSSAKPWARFEAYVAASSAKANTSALWLLQAHWQSSAETIAFGLLHGGSLLVDENKAGVNAWMASQLQARTLPAVGLLELDNVCDGGPAVAAALREQYG